MPVSFEANSGGRLPPSSAAACPGLVSDFFRSQGEAVLAWCLRWRLAGRSPDLVKVRSIPLVKGGPPNPSGAASRAESGASEGVAREVVPLDPPNEVMRAIAELEELNADANVHYKEQCVRPFAPDPPWPFATNASRLRRVRLRGLPSLDPNPAQALAQESAARPVGAHECDCCKATTCQGTGKPQIHGQWLRALPC